MNRLRIHGMAAIGSAALLVLSTSGAFASQTRSSGGLQVSSAIHHQVGDMGATTGETDPTDVTDPTPTEDPTSDASAHGACVSAVAKSDAVGGKNNNHGGAVSEAARVTCWEPPAAPVVTDATTTTRIHGSAHRANKHHA